MKKMLSVLLAVMMLFVLAACSTSTDAPEGGETPPVDSGDTNGGDVAEAVTLSGTSAGFGGEISVEVMMEGDTITSVTVTGHTETEGIGTAAIDKLPGDIVANNSLAVEAVAGATVSSDAIIAATEVALVSGGFDPSNYMTAVSSGVNGEKTDEVIEADIVIVGAGGAGLTAAIEATQAGKSVVVLEKMSFAGGNSIKATGGMNAAETSVQAAEGIPDTVEVFVQDTLDGGGNIADVALVTKMAEESAAAVEWLGEIGAPLVQVSFSGGATYSRIHQPEGGAAVGAFIVEKLVDKAEELGVDVMYNTTVTEIVMTDGVATGVMANSSDANYTVNAGAVILASGGFGANEDMYASYRPDLAGFVTTNHSGATGDGIMMAEAVGAALVDVEYIQIHPTVHQETSMLITEGVRGDGAILVNQSGKRFINELETRDVVSAAEIAQEGGYAYVVFDQNLRENLAATEKYVTNGLTVQADTIEELGTALGIDPATLSETLGTWNEAVANQNDAEFGRTTGMEHDLSTAPYYAIKLSPGVHHTMGGVKINTETEVLTESGDIIPGLFAAGEVVGGIHGNNRIGGNAVADFVVFGLVSGQSAIAYTN